MPPAGQFERRSFGMESTKRDSLQSDEANNVQLLEFKNTELRRKLSKTRAKSREKLIQVTQDRQQLSTENNMLRQECETLRNLFIRQQQQQIAFWAGPFMEMILPKGASQSTSSDLLLGKLAHCSFEGLASGDVHETSELADASSKHMQFQKAPTGSEQTSSKEMPLYLSAEQRLIRSIPTPLSAKRNLMTSLEATPRSQKAPESTIRPANDLPNSERKVVHLDLCGEASHPIAGLQSRGSHSSSDSSECFLPDNGGLSGSDSSDESVRSAFV
jgi:hypothetical protein